MKINAYNINKVSDVIESPFFTIRDGNFIVNESDNYKLVVSYPGQFSNKTVDLIVLTDNLRIEKKFSDKPLYKIKKKREGNPHSLPNKQLKF